MASYTKEDGTVVSGKELPKKPVPATKEEVTFITKMIIDELAELLATVTDSGEERKDILLDLVSNADMREDLEINKEFGTSVIEEQADALVDIEYYSKDFAAKKGIDLDSIFEVVHQANMDKRDENGNFVKRHDGKVIKPAGWKAANITTEVHRQMEEGSFED